MKLYVLHAEDGSVLGFTDGYASAFGGAAPEPVHAGQFALRLPPEKQKPRALRGFCSSRFWLNWAHAQTSLASLLPFSRRACIRPGAGASAAGRC
jgi:hypothetical protein